MAKKKMIAGQAVIEGVMLRSGNKMATAVQTPKKITVRKETYHSVMERVKFLRLPFLRGIIMFFEMIVLGVKLVDYSASQATPEEEPLGFWGLIISITLAILFVLLIFKLVPYAAASFLSGLIQGRNLTLNLFEAAIKVSIFVLYLVLIGLMPDVKRMFQFHGAEHKTVNCYEAGKKVTVKNVMQCSKRQPRCGMTFIIIVIFLSIFFYIAIPFGYSFWTKYGLRIALLPLIAGISYELIRLAARKYRSSKIVRFLIAPGLWFQDLTTKEPTAKQVKVAIAAFNGLGIKK